MVHRASRLVVYPARFAFLKAWRASRRAFTLVELMFVLAIIALLIGLLAMAVREGIERAKSTSCRNNLRQYGIAIGKYMSDWDGYFPQKNWRAPGAKFDTSARIINASSDRTVMAAGARVGYDLVAQGFEDGAMPKNWGAGEVNYLTNEIDYVVLDFIQSYVLAGNETDIRHCPRVAHSEIFDTNSLYFKGYYVTRDVSDELDICEPDLAGALSSYAWSPYLGSRPNDGVIAFIDWNAVQGWGASIGGIEDANIASWVMDWGTVGAAVSNLYGTGSKGAPARQTEIGYHHRSGGDQFANYVAVDGHVSTISSNASLVEFRKLFLGY